MDNKYIENSFSDIETFINDVMDYCSNSTDASASIIGKFESIREMVEIAISRGGYIMCIDSFADPWVSGYEDEYILGFIDDEIWVEPMKREGEYIYVYDDKVFVLDEEVNHKALAHVSGGQMICVEFVGGSDCANCDEEDCEHRYDAKPIFDKERDDRDWMDIEAKLNRFKDDLDKEFTFEINDPETFVEFIKEIRSLNNFVKNYI